MHLYEEGKEKTDILLPHSLLQTAENGRVHGSGASKCEHWFTMLRASNRATHIIHTCKQKSTFPYTYRLGLNVYLPSVSVNFSTVGMHISRFLDLTQK